MKLTIFSGLPGTGKSSLAEAIARDLGSPVFAKDCSDEVLHRLRLQERKRNIPGWHELEWEDVEKVKRYYLPWKDECLKLDMMNLYDDNLAQAKAYCKL